MEAWYLIVLWSLVPIVIVGISVVFVPNFILLVISISTPFWLGRASLDVSLAFSSQKFVLVELIGL